MLLLMAFAALYGVLQLAVLGLGSRSLRAGTLVLAVVVGAYVCAPAAVLLELVTTRIWQHATGQSMQVVVRSASYTTDPAIEEVVKLAPLLLLVALAPRRLAQLGLVDFLLLGASVGTGFSLAEALMRYSSTAARAVPDGAGGYLLPINISVPRIPGLRTTLTTWLPPPSSTQGVFEVGLGLNYHLLWTGLAALGLGVAIRVRRRWGLLGIASLVLAALDHAATNAQIALTPASSLGALLQLAEEGRDRLPTVVLLSMIGATAFDRRALHRGRVAVEEGLSARLGPAQLLHFAVTAPPFSTARVLRFVLARRAASYAAADGRPDPELSHDLAEVQALVDDVAPPGRWRLVRRGLLGRVRPPLSWTRRVLLVVWVVLALPPLAYGVLGATPSTVGLQRLLLTPAGRVGCAVDAVLALGYGATHVVLLGRALRRPCHGWLEPRLRGASRLLVGISALVTLAAVLVVWRTGRSADQSVVANAHALDAVGSLLVIVGLLLLIAALVAMFPPSGLMLAIAGGGTAATIAGVSAVSVAQVGVVAGTSGAVLMAVSKGSRGGGRPGARGGSGGSPRDNDRQNAQYKAAIREGERRLGRPLKDEERERVHREISGQHYNYHEIVEVVEELFG